jgi:hypothetical protein
MVHNVIVSQSGKCVFFIIEYKGSIFFVIAKVFLENLVFWGVGAFSDCASFWAFWLLRGAADGGTLGGLMAICSFSEGCLGGAL